VVLASTCLPFLDFIKKRTEWYLVVCIGHYTLLRGVLADAHLVSESVDDGGGSIFYIYPQMHLYHASAGTLQIRRKHHQEVGVCHLSRQLRGDELFIGVYLTTRTSPLLERVVKEKKASQDDVWMPPREVLQLLLYFLRGVVTLEFGVIDQPYDH
jgi:hypothetical protein